MILASDISSDTQGTMPLSTSNATSTKTTGVMHMTDTLDAGGRERVAVNIVNCLPRDRYHTHLCTTRRDGPLAMLAEPDVGRLCLQRKRTLEWKAIRQLVGYIRKNRIDILHAHGTSLLYAYLASLFRPSLRVVWHDHYGTNESKERSVWTFRQLTRRVDAVLAVSQPLADWSRQRLGFRDDRIWCLPNFPSPELASSGPPVALPGSPGMRVVHVANLRPVKDQRSLLKAMHQVVSEIPEACLLMVGAESDLEYTAAVKRDIDRLGLGKNVTLLGQRDDVPEILNACDVGVLSSTSEGLPVSLLEYGAAGLSIVATDVGQVADVLDNGRAGTLVQARRPSELAAAICEQLNHPERRDELGTAIRNRVAGHYSRDAVIGQLCNIYDQIL